MFRYLILAGSMLAATAHAADSKPKYGPNAVRLVDDHAYIKTHAAPDYWALMSYYLPQQNESSCSVASVSMVSNALRAHQKLTASDELVTQKNVVKKLGLDFFTKGVEEGGHGVALDQLGEVMTKVLKEYGLKGTVKVLHAADTAEFKKQIHAALVQNEKSDSDFILANFLQSEYTGDPEGAVGHIAPVAAFDSKAGRVLIFDPDRTYYEPYWVSEAVFLKGLNTQDKAGGKTRGIVWVQLEK